MKVGLKKALVCSLALAIAAIGGSYQGFAQDKEKDKKKAAKGKDDEARAAKLKEKQEEMRKLQQEIAELGGAPGGPGAAPPGGPGAIQGVDMEAMKAKMKGAMRGGGKGDRERGHVGPPMGMFDSGFGPNMEGREEMDPIHASRQGMVSAAEANLQYLANLIKGAESDEERAEYTKQFEEEAAKLIEKRKALRDSEIKRLEKRLAELKDPEKQKDGTVDELKEKYLKDDERPSNPGEEKEEGDEGEEESE